MEVEASEPRCTESEAGDLENGMSDFNAMHGKPELKSNHDSQCTGQPDLSEIVRALAERNTIFFCKNSKQISTAFMHDILTNKIDCPVDKKLVVLMDSSFNVQKLRPVHRNNEVCLFDTEWPTPGQGCTYDNIVKYLDDWKEAWSSHSVIFAGISQFCTLCWHGHVSFGQIAYLVLEDAAHVTQNHLFTKVFRYFYFPLRADLSGPRVCGFYGIERLANLDDPSQVQGFCVKLRFYQKELDCHCKIVDNERLANSIREFMGEEQKYPAMPSSIFSYSSVEHLICILQNEISCLTGRINSNIDFNSYSICLVVKDSYQSNKIFAELGKTHANGYLIQEIVPGNPMKYFGSQEGTREDFQFHRFWDSTEVPFKFVLIDQSNFSHFIAKNVLFDKIWFISNDSEYLFPSLHVLQSLPFYRNVEFDFWIANGDDCTQLYQALANESLSKVKGVLYNKNNALVTAVSTQVLDQNNLHCNNPRQPSESFTISSERTLKNVYNYFFGSWIYMNETVVALRSSTNVVLNKETGAILCYWNAVELLTRFCSCLPRYVSGEARQPNFKTSNIAKPKDMSHFSNFFLSEVTLPQIKDLQLDSYGQLTTTSVKGKVCTSKPESLQSAAYETCLLLISNQLLDANLLPTARLGPICREAEERFVYQRQTFNPLFFPSCTPIQFDHYIPKVLQFIPDLKWNDTFYLYAIETRLVEENVNKNDVINSSTVNDYVQFKQFSLSQFPSTATFNKSPFTVGILTCHKLPKGLGSFPLSIPNPIPGQPKFMSTCQLRYLGTHLFASLPEYQSMLQLQLTMFNFLVHTIHLQELGKHIGQPERSIDPPTSNLDHSQMLMYFLVPLTRKNFVNHLDFDALFNLYLAFKNNTSVSAASTGSEWSVDLAVLDTSSSNLISLNSYQEYLKTWWATQSFDEAEFQGFFQFCAKSFYFLRSYHPALCKFTEYSTFEYPLSTFECKSHPECRTFADFFHAKYGLVITAKETPLVKYKFSKGYEKMLWESCSSSYTAPSLERPKRQPAGRSSLVPDEFFLITNIPTGISPIIHLVPSVMHRLMNECLAYELYNKVTNEFLNFTHPPTPPVTLQALTFSTANPTCNYERLEFLGDTLLKFGSTIGVFSNAQHRYTEAEMSDLRQRVISNSALFPIALEKDFDWHCYPLPFNHKIWAPPHIRSLFWSFDSLSASHRAMAEIFFSEHYYWNIRSSWVSSMAAKHQSTELDVDGNHVLNEWIPPEHVLERRPVPYTSKTMADLVEAFLGACHVGSGTEHNLPDSMQALVSLGILHDNPWKHAHSLFMIQRELQTVNCTNLLPDLQRVETILQYKFNHPLLLQLAYTPPSTEAGLGYERLEFLGDAILDLLVVEHFYYQYPSLTPNQLSEYKMLLTNNLAFGTIFVLNSLHLPIASSIAQEAQAFISQIQEESLDGTVVPQFYSMSEDCPKLFGDMFESIAGALWLDSGFDYQQFRSSFWPLLAPWADRNADPAQRHTTAGSENPVGKFLGQVQRYGIPGEQVSCQWNTTEPGKTNCTVLIRNVPVGSAIAGSKALARRLAMSDAYERFERDGLYRQFIL